MHIATTENFRNKNIGNKMLDLFFDFCKKEGVKIVTVVYSSKNTKARNFYIKNGFAESDITMKKYL